MTFPTNLTGPDEEYACAVCDCRRCEESAYVDVNTGVVSKDEGPSDECWCPECETHDTRLVVVKVKP